MAKGRWAAARLTADSTPGSERAPLHTYGATAEITVWALVSEADLVLLLSVFGGVCDTGHPRNIQFETVAGRRRKRERRQRGLSQAFSSAISFVSYVSFVSKRLAPQTFDS
jgi:hypothetical protein